MHAQPVRLDFRLAVEPPIAAELATEAFADPRFGQSVAVVQDRMGQLVRQDYRQLPVAGLCRQRIAELDHAAVRARGRTSVREDFDERAALRRRGDGDLPALPAAYHVEQ